MATRQVVKKACTECRQQKSRCDKFINLDAACTRCKKLGRDDTECVISDPFRRENKRRKLSELEHETKQLRERLKRAAADDRNEALTTHSRSTSTLMPTLTTPPAITSRLIGNNVIDRSVDESHLHQQWHQKQQQQEGQEGQNQEQGHSARELDRQDQGSLASSPLQPQTVDGYTVEVFEIAQLFEIYFRDFHPHLPVLDPLRSPSSYVQDSPVLFWAIIGVASRAYDKKPELLRQLHGGVHVLAFDSLKQPPTPEGVQALLLLVTWPFPKTPTTWSPTFALGGGLLHLAMGIGLHMPASAQEFSKVKIRMTDAEVTRRAETLAYCVITYQRLCVCKGSPMLTLSDICQDPSQRRLLFTRLNANATACLRLQDTLSRACKAISENGLQEMGEQEEMCLDVLIKTFSTEIDSVSGHSLSTIECLHTSIAKLVIQVLHFYKEPARYDGLSVTRIFDLACRLIEDLEAVCQLHDSGGKSSPFYLIFSLLLASHALLRNIKVPKLQLHIDVGRATLAIHRAIELAKVHKVYANDTADRAANIIQQSLGSPKMYRDPDDPDMPAPLRVRSRLTASLVLDGTVWWREEFGGYTGIYPTPLQKESNDQAMTVPQEQSDMTSDNVCDESGWLDLDYLFPMYGVESDSWLAMMNP